METTIADTAKLAAAMVQGELVSKASKTEFVRSQLAIKSRTQFPVLSDAAPEAENTEAWRRLWE